MRAVTRALHDRQTVVLSLPLDVQDANSTALMRRSNCRLCRAACSPDPRIYAGSPRPWRARSARSFWPGAAPCCRMRNGRLIALADRIGALLATSVCGHGLFAENPWSLGISGGFSSPVADELISESDLILGFGVSFTQWTTKKGKLIAPGAIVAQIDIEAPKLGYQMPVQHAVLGDAKATAEALLAELGRRGMSSPKQGRRNDRMRERIRSGDNHHSPIPTNRARSSSIRGR